MSCPYLLLEPSEETLTNMLRGGEAQFMDLRNNKITFKDFILEEIEDLSQWIEEHIFCLNMSKLHYQDTILGGFYQEGYECAKRLEDSAFGWRTKDFFKHVKRFEDELLEIQTKFYSNKTIDAQQANDMSIEIIKKYNLNYTTEEMRQNIFEQLSNDFEEGFNSEEIHDVYNDNIKEFGDNETFKHLYMYYCEEYIVQSDLKVGDICLTISYYESRPEYGVAIIGYGINNNKTLVTDSEGQPELSDNIIMKLKNRKVEYNNVNNRLAEALRVPRDTILLPTVALKIMGSAPRNLGTK